MKMKRFVVCGLIAVFAALSSAFGQVKSDNHDAGKGSFWTEQDDKITDDITTRGYSAVEKVGAVESHGGPDEMLGQTAKYYENLAKGLDIHGNPIPREVWRSWFDGADKAEQFAKFKTSCGRIAKELNDLGMAITIVDSGAKVAGHLAEGDLVGGLITASDEMCKIAALAAATTAGLFTSGPFGAIGMGAMTEEYWATHGHEFFEREKQRQQNLQKIFTLAGKKIRDPDVKAYMSGDISIEQLRRRIADRRIMVKGRWLDLAAEYPEIKDEVNLLLDLKATSRQRAKLHAVDRLDRASKNNPEVRKALNAWMSGKVTRKQLNVLRKVLGKPPIVDLDPVDIVGRWTDGELIITDAPLAKLIRESAGSSAELKTKGMEGCDMLPPEALLKIADSIEKQLNRPMVLNMTIAGNGTEGVVTMLVIPPEGVDKSQNKPMTLNYKFSPNILQAEGAIYDGQGYLALQGRVSIMNEGLILRGSWELRGGNKGGKPNPNAAVMLRGTLSVKKPHAKPN